MIEKSPFFIKKDFYREYTYYVCSNINQYRCGYVVIPKSHPWYEKHYKDINMLLDQEGKNVHGKLTFSAFEESDTKREYLIGFDCGHINDLPDKLLYKLEGTLGKLIEEMNHHFKRLECVISETKPGERTIKTTEFVEEECKKLIDLVVAYS